jgi:virulence-associated protein VagC
MIFGRVEAIAVLNPVGDSLALTVYLETGRQIEVVREESVAILRPIETAIDVAWHADQYAQETIANELALEGWEVIGAGEIPDVEPGAMARSAAYAVRRLSYADSP